MDLATLLGFSPPLNIQNTGPLLGQYPRTIPRTGTPRIVLYQMPTNTQAQPSPAGSSASDGYSPNSVSTGPTPVPTSLTPAMPTFINFTGEDGVVGLAASGKRTSNTTRRVNTAKRRATHNAVERQRRETLNGRFLDLAALLSNLNQIRRPSKSEIVNSAIAHLNASRRHRRLAAQQLRIMKNETEALRNEVNEWRAHARAPFSEEPMRSDAFGIVIRGEIEFEAGDMLDADEGEEDEGANGGVYGGRQYGSEPGSYEEASVEEYALLQRQRQQQVHAAQAEMLAAQMHQQQQQQSESQSPFAHSPSAPMNPGHRQSASPSAHYYTASPTIVNPGFASFENPGLASFENPDITHGYDYPHPGRSRHAKLGAPLAYEKQQQQMLHAAAQHGSW
ncbi:hypothetical protein B0H14DRAFT_3763031 [Mycena olivaceomarginata]|nr:hypothetical protein B0H14DRAFT_3763031 [Mycena olivaceomarginata]